MSAVMTRVMIIHNKTISTHGRNHNVESIGTYIYRGVRPLNRFHIFIFFLKVRVLTIILFY